MFVCLCVCVCVCIRVDRQTYIYAHTLTHTCNTHTGKILRALTPLVTANDERAATLGASRNNNKDEDDAGAGKHSYAVSYLPEMQMPAAGASDADGGLHLLHCFA